MVVTALLLVIMGILFLGRNRGLDKASRALKNLKIRVENGDEEDVLLTDPVRMEKVVLNLLTNAIKHTPVSGSVTVRWRCSAEEVCIEVSDTGVGISCLFAFP